MARRDDISVLCAIAIALAAPSAAAAPRPVESWGRAGVAYETYRNDALECGLVGYYADVSKTEQAQAFVSATRQLEAVDNPNYVPPNATPADAAYLGAEQARHYEQIRRSIRPEQAMRALKQGMVAVVEDCLKGRGYVQFRLTDEQSEALSKLDKGSEERREFLYRLASDASILETQHVPSTAS